MRTIAIEEHFLARGFGEVMAREASKRGGGANAGFPAELQAKLADLGDLRLKDMDAGGIDLQVISHGVIDGLSLPDVEMVRLARQANDQLAEAVAAHPTRFAGFATLPMVKPEAAADEMERTVRSLGFKGALINGTTNGRFLDDPSFLPVLERAVALDVPIYIHPAFPPAPVWEAYYAGFDPAVSSALSRGGWGWHSETAIHALRLILSGVFDRLPGLQIIIGHMGEMLPFMFARIQNVLSPVAKHLQHPVPEYFLRNFHFTTSGFFTDPPLLLALELMGADRIIFSVDYPYSTNQQGRAFLDSASISPDDKEKISHLNAERLLKLTATSAESPHH
ncbi:MAG TPA: amidohydrolase family protein [Ktedonobacteraceae bacterium]|jgi:predicted TIM-barrel fold metal-dependent hydrolase|nr:amidohydrolase family protein [Ktedonobacteraceae bacterium]